LHQLRTPTPYLGYFLPPACPRIAQSSRDGPAKLPHVNCISVVRYGIVFTISRQMLVNDDLNAIDQMLGSAGDPPSF
jgi:hypothetical protein